MNKIKKYCKNFVLILLLFSAKENLFAVPDSLVYKIKDKGDGLNVAMNGSSLAITQNQGNTECWFFNSSDLYKFALKNFDDHNWKNIESDFETDSIFKGICWMRLHYKVSAKFVGKTFMMQMSHFGASEIFNDSKFLISFGKVSVNIDEEISIDPGKDYFPLTVNDTLEHVISVRYSNAAYKLYQNKFGIDKIGFNLRFFKYDDMEEIQLLKEYQLFFFVGLSLFLFALALVHLMIYLFERSRKFNLYHSLFVGALSLLFLMPILHRIIETPIVSFRLTYYSDALIPAFFISALTLLYNLFQKKLNKFFYICLIVFILSLVFKYIVNDFYDLFYITLFFMMYIGCTVISIKAIRQNFRGAKIVGLGVLGTTIFMILSILSLVIFKGNGFILGILFVIFGILSLPISMSVYLAFDFAKANKTLTEQIIQIENLSAKALQDEQEKKQILENQNQMLEVQVKERTAEIEAQNTLLEDQKKEITDSINYAKRIQQSILPADEDFAKLVPKNFILFMPKDIVSGDFYFLHSIGEGRNEADKLFVAVADCTGHGVPGALMSMVAHEKLQEAVEQNSEPSKILSLMNQNIKKTLKQNNADGSSRDGCDIILLKIESKNKVVYSGANRALYIIRKNSSVVEEIKATKCAIGGFTSDEQEYQQHDVMMNEGDIVYLFSDGYADQFGGDKLPDNLLTYKHGKVGGKKLTTKKFKDLLLSIQHLPINEQGNYLQNFILTWRDDIEQVDDILVIGIKF